MELDVVWAEVFYGGIQMYFLDMQEHGLNLTRTDLP